MSLKNFNQFILNKIFSFDIVHHILFFIYPKKKVSKDIKKIRFKLNHLEYEKNKTFLLSSICDSKSLRVYWRFKPFNNLCLYKINKKTFKTKFKTIKYK